LHVWQVVEEEQTAQLAMLQLGMHCVLALLVMKRSMHVSQVVVLAHLLQ